MSAARLESAARLVSAARLASALRLAPAAVALALLLAACGSTPSSPVAHVSSGSTPGTTPASAAVGASAGRAATAGGPASGGGSESHSSVGIAGVSGASALKFAICVRAHGQPSFPDPNAQGAFQISGGNGFAQFRPAMQACQKLLHLGGAPPSPAQQAQAVAALLKYSECMRAHGVPSFPDPTTSGGGVGISIHGGPGTGLDPSSPIFQRAQAACQSLMPGGPGGGP